jgi:hypothetical protein
MKSRGSYVEGNVFAIQDGFRFLVRQFPFQAIPSLSSKM